MKSLIGETISLLNNVAQADNSDYRYLSFGWENAPGT